MAVHNNRLVIEHILKTHKITDYLASKNILPAKHTGDKISYHCPLHEGDNTPSFFVYLTSGNYQNFHCFSCLKNGNLIHLKQHIDKISFPEALKTLSVGFDIEDISICSEMAKNLYSPPADKLGDGVEQIALRISRMGYKYLKSVNFDKTEFDLMEAVYKKIDIKIKEMDIDALKTAYPVIRSAISKRKCVNIIKK